MKVLYFCTGYIIFSLIGYHEAVRIVRIRQPPLMKSQSTDITTSWDLPVGSTITVECEKPSQTLTYETHPLAENDQRFGGGRFVHNSSANAWTLSDLQSSDTGWLVCFNNGSIGSGSNNENTTVELADVESTQNSSLYIFVNSPDSLDMFVPLEYLVFYKLFFGAYFPCLPTNSSTEVTLILGPDLTNQLTELVKGVDYIFDKQEGVKLLQIPSEESFYTCQYTNGGDTVSHSYYLYIVDLAALPHPILSPTTQRTHYLVGEDLTMVCYILFDDIESVVYKYPASNCSYDIIDNLGCDKLKTKGRITMTPLTKVSPTNVTSSITIRDLQLNDSGLYTCSYKIYQDTEYRRQGSLEIHVVALPPSSKGIGFSTQTVQTASQLVAGDNFYMHCHVARFECSASQVAITGSGGVRYTQGHDDVFWAENDNSYILSVNLTGTTRNMTGNRYLCGCNSKTSDVMLTVQEFVRPFWALKSDAMINITVGDTETFTCQAGGQPLPNVMWFKDNKRTLNDSTTVVLGRNNHSLTIYKATLEDSGSYSCVGMTRRSPPIYSNFTLTVTARTAKLKNVGIVMIAVLVPAVIFIIIATIVCVIRQRRQTREEVPLERLSTNKNL